MKTVEAALIAALAAGWATAAAAEPMPVTRSAVERRAAQMFTMADVDRDGWLTRVEYQSAVVRQAQRFDPNVPTTGKGMDTAMAQFDALASAPGAGDAQRGGRIPRNVFVTAATARFDAADLNHDGTVTPEEAREAGAVKRPEKPAKARKARKHA